MVGIPSFFVNERKRALKRMIEDMIVVNMADYKLARGKQKLITRDLGSCIAVALRDPRKEIGGLLHIMLPGCPYEVPESTYPKYADKGIDLMISKLAMAGADKHKLVAKIAGGAHIVKTENVPESQDISSRNLNAVCQKLQEYKIPILASEVGDYFPRTVIFEPASGTLQIKTVGKEDRFL